MRISKTSSRFRKDYTRLKKSGRRDMSKLHFVMEKLIDKKPLSKIYKDHPLQGDWKNFRDCHIEGDWVLIYKFEKDKQERETIIFHATGNHSNLFG